MSRFHSLLKQRPGFVGYLTAGDGGAQFTVEAALALIDGGVDILELGVPFSDPVADGPMIQRACQRALQGGTRPGTVLEIAAQIRRQAPGTPLVLFSYFNPILQQGPGFLESAKQAGLDGLLVLDLPFDHSYLNQVEDLELVRILSPSTSESRLKEIVRQKNGFLYYACQKGTTGARAALPADLSTQLQRIQKVTDTPVVVGFGVSTRDSAKAIADCAHGFVVGSAFVKLIEEGASPEDLKKAAQQIDPRGSNP